MTATIHFAHGPRVRVPVIRKDLGVYILWGHWRLVRGDAVTIADKSERVQILNT